jgi:glycosyl transferase, family 25
MNNNYLPINNFFDKIYVLTLRQSADRQTQIIKELYGLNFSFYVGVDKDYMTQNPTELANNYSEALAVKNHRYHKPMWPGQIGCSWSHLNIYKDIVANKYSKTLILEDDVYLAENGIRHFEKAIEYLPQNWQLLYLDYAKNEKKPALGSLKQFIYSLQQKAGKLNYTPKTISVNEYIKKTGWHDYTNAYAITMDAAAQLIELQTPIQFIADNLLAYACTNNIINGYCVQHKVFNQYSQQGTTISLVNQ